MSWSEDELSQGREIASGIRRHLKTQRAAEKKQRKLALDAFPFDAWLLSISPLYRRSREKYLKMGGTFRVATISSGRSLSSDALLEPRIEYTPMAEEMYWSAVDRVECASPGNSLSRILELRSWCAPVFHEQTHRLLWSFLPPPPKERRGIHRYLNFTEALVVATDMALGDLLGPGRSRLFYLVGSTYDPGTKVWSELHNRRRYRNYLHAAVLATYLNLELYEADDIRKIVRHLHPGLGRYTERVVDRCLRLDRAFVEVTNVTWQEKNWRKLRRLKGAGSARALTVTKDRLDHSQIYLWSERWFEEMGL